MIELLADVRFFAPAVGLLAGGAVAVAIHLRERKQAKTLPFLPSIEEGVGQRDAYTEFFAATHDAVMCVTEAWNSGNARLRGGAVEELIDRHRLSAAADRMVLARDAIREELADYRLSNETARAARHALEACWSYTWKDEYRTETYLHSFTDKDGRHRTETRTRQVYDHTIHHWAFRAELVPLAVGAVEELLESVVEEQLPRPRVKGRSLDIDRLDDGQRMFLRRLVRDTVLEDPEAEVSDEEAALYTRQWLDGTSLDAQLATFRRGLGNLRSQRTSGLGLLAGSRSETRKTYSTGPTEGPAGYEASTELAGHAASAVDAWEAVELMLVETVQAVQTLAEHASDPDEVESDREYAEHAIAAYESAFPKSLLEVDQLPRRGRTALIGLGVGAGVALLTWLAHASGYLVPATW